MKKLIALLISGVIMLPCVNAFANDVIEVYIDAFSAVIAAVWIYSVISVEGVPG